MMFVPYLFYQGTLQYSVMNKNEKSADFIIIGVFVSILALCIFIFLLPAEVQEAFKARTDTWNLVTFFTSTFVHANFNHLLGNLTSLISFGAFIYTINRISNRRKQFLTSLLLIIALLPFIYNISFALIANFVIKRSLVSCGLSTVVAGLIGLTVPSLCIFVRDLLQSEHSTLYFLTSLMFLTGSAMAFPYISFGLYNLVVFITTCSLGVALLSKVGKEVIASAKQKPNTKKTATIALTIVLIYFTFLMSLFPSDIIISQGNTVNIFAHYVGIFYGIISGIYTLNVFQRNHRPEISTRDLS